MVENSPIVQRLQQELGFSMDVYAHGVDYLQKARAGKLDAKYNETLLACVAVYIYCRRNGVNITMSKICEVVPITREELMNAYEDVRKIV